MNSKENTYGIRRSGIQHGDVFTASPVVCHMLDLLGYSPDRDLSFISILEPSCGEGAFLIEIVRRLRQSSINFRFDFQTAFEQNVFGYDIDPIKIECCIENLTKEGININENTHIFCADILLCNISKFDIIVGNPPYIRYEQIPENKLTLYKSIFETFHYRADLYILFFEKTLLSLKKHGKHCFICSNRWLKNEYGKKLRSFIVSFFRIDKIISLEKANDAFQTQVLAYPAITLISKSEQKSTFAYSELTSVNALSTNSVQMLPSPSSSDWSSIFFHTDRNYLTTIENMGFHIGIGIATGADDIYISKELPSLIENELLLPAINARDLSGDKFHWSGQYLLNPYDNNGQLINLEQYPKASAYLMKNKDYLQRRHIAQKHPEKWYRTIDKLTPELVTTPKILLPDISGNQMVFIDYGEFYPQHNIYYITGISLIHLQILSAILMSDFAKKQLTSITNCMNGGYPRWQSQYLRKLMLPDVRELTPDITVNLLSAYSRRDITSINSTINNLLDTPWKTLKRHQKTEQLSIDFPM